MKFTKLHMDDTVFSLTNKAKLKLNPARAKLTHQADPISGFHDPEAT